MHMAARTLTRTHTHRQTNALRDRSESVAVICVTNARHKQLLHGARRVGRWGGADGEWTEAQLNVGLGIVMLAKLCDSDSHLQNKTHTKHENKQSARDARIELLAGKLNWNLSSIRSVACDEKPFHRRSEKSSQAERLEIEVDRAFTPSPFPTRESV